MGKIEEVIVPYGIRPVNIYKMTENVHIIDDGQQKYALKKSMLTNERVATWERVFHEAHQQQLSSILPLFLTRNNALYTIYDGDYYYLTPFINRGQQASIEQLYRCVGKIHKQTKQLQPVENEQMVNQFLQYKKYCDYQQKKLLSFVKTFESHTYMSPFELQVCTHYRDIELAFIKIRNQVYRFLDERDEALQWCISLCHGNLRLSHSIEAHRTYIMNWEQAIYEHPITDLVTLFKNEIIDYDAPVETFIQSFNVYMSENKLNNDELSLLLIHLLDPSNYMFIIEKYIEQTSNETIIRQVQKLQMIYRQVMFGLQMVDIINQNYLAVILNDQD